MSNDKGDGGSRDCEPTGTCELTGELTGTGAKALSPAAQRALVEAAERRALAAQDAQRVGEQGGPAGAEPTRFGDWERKGIAVDF